MFRARAQFIGYPAGSGLLVSKDSISRFSIRMAVSVRRTEHSLCTVHQQFPLFHSAQHSIYNSFKSWDWLMRSSADGNRLNSSPTNDFIGGTRLIKVINEIQIKLGSKISALRKNLPVKLLFFLVGFYCATAFATVIGQTGDWDILSAALGVLVVEGIGALMYKSSPLSGKVASERVDKVILTVKWFSPSVQRV